MYKVIRDTREKDGHGWTFQQMEIGTLKTGDYTLVGHEQEIAIERKASVSEISMNIFEKRFENELIRMEDYAYPFLLMEFSMEDVMQFPAGSDIPKYKWKYLKVSPYLILKKILEFQIKYKTKWIFCGKYGQDVCNSIFKRFIENGNSVQ